MPIEAVGAFHQSSVEHDHMRSLSRKVTRTPTLTVFNDRRYLSIQEPTPVRPLRTTRVLTQQPEFLGLVGKQIVAARDSFLQWSLSGVSGSPLRGGVPTAEDDEQRVRENLTYLVVRDLVGREKIGAAREFLARLPLEYLSDPLILRLLKTLAKPVVRRCAKQDVDRQIDYDWLREHAREYRGQWVALQDGQLLAVSPTLREISEKVKARGLSRPPLLHRILC